MSEPNKRWRIETRVTVTRVYLVNAPDAKAAEEASVGALHDHEEDEDEETLSIVEVD
jgi:hypothetical protein